MGKFFHGWVLALGLATAVQAQDLSLPIETDLGQVLGTKTGAISVFRGIPYAAPPVGDLRWRPPQPAAPWEGIRDATAFGPPCAQGKPNPSPYVLQEPFSEDCLTLNIWSPDVTAKKKLPVMFWIHGGSARFGSGAEPFYDGTELAKQGVVVVTINYRLDRLGRFAHPALTKEQPGQALANYGWMDMVAALQWVNRNIGNFGGDANEVTIFGQSAGGIAVTTLMATPSSKGLFKRAIAESGSGTVDRPQYVSAATPYRLSLEDDGLRMAEKFGINDGDVMKRLRALPWQEIVAYSMRGFQNSLLPAVDGVFLPAPVGDIFAQGQQHAVPFMTGTNSWEESLISRGGPPLPLRAILEGVTEEQARAMYPGRDDAALTKLWFADATFHAPARFFAGQMEKTKAPAYTYYFSYMLEVNRGKAPGVPHGEEIMYLFNNLDTFLGPALTERDKNVAKQMSAYWVQFAKTGNPNIKGAPLWKPYNAKNPATLVIDDEIVMAKDHLNERIAPHLQRFNAFVAKK
ncbi:MAG: carboxylesterase family protein [Rhodospirillaceae bacterium]|nr:carboxylesterase family protein [Rhodospirillaceae bacterium]